MGRDWEEFYKFADVIDTYMPAIGEGDSKASQICTAVNKLVYKWYNDGDVFDNTKHLDGWMNDLSSYANWLYKNTDVETKEILLGVYECYDDDDYEELLYALCEHLIDVEKLMAVEEIPVVGSIYKADGMFKFIEREDEEDDWDIYDEDDDDEDDWDDEEWE